MDRPFMEPKAKEKNPSRPIDRFSWGRCGV